MTGGGTAIDIHAPTLASILAALYRHGARSLVIDASGSIGITTVDGVHDADLPRILVTEALVHRRQAIMLLFQRDITRPTAEDCARAEYDALPSRRVVYLCSAAGTNPVAAIMPLSSPPPPAPPPPPPAPPRRESWYSAAECDAWLLANGWTRDENGNWRSPRDS